jgi:L-seryl-tRNA(Ser) seleniumtransferase
LDRARGRDRLRDMTSILERLGASPIINACGTVTRLGGGPLHPDVLAAMADASRVCFDMTTLQAAACRVIAKATGAAAGIVTSGASAAVLLGAAACLTLTLLPSPRAAASPAPGPQENAT